MIGKGVLLECLDDVRVKNVVTIGRSSSDIEHPKLKEIIHTDFLNYDAIRSDLEGFDAAYLCMGVSSSGLKEAEYTRLTYDFTLSLARTLYELNPGMTLTYVSGQGTDSTENGRTMWARVKGKTENDLLKMGFARAFMYRPGSIIPLRGIKSKTPMYQFFYDYFLWLVKLIKLLAPNSTVNTTDIGRSMINVAEMGYEKNILTPKDILITAHIDEDK